MQKKMQSFRNMKKDDLARVVWLEAENFTDAWTMQGVLETYEQNHSLITVVEENGVVNGYCILYYVLDEGEIARIAVAKTMQHKGLGRKLLDYTCACCKEKGVTRLLLDVRESNQNARRFYEAYGFTIDGIRKCFYTDPVEDAVLMSKEIDEYNQ